MNEYDKFLLQLTYKDSHRWMQYLERRFLSERKGNQEFSEWFCPEEIGVARIYAMYDSDNETLKSS